MLLTPLFEAIGRPKSVFHELHVFHLSLFVDLTPYRERADGHLSQGSRAIGEAAKDRYVFSNAEQGLDLESLNDPYPVDGVKGIDDSLCASWDTFRSNPSTQARLSGTFRVAACVWQNLGEIRILVIE